MRYSGYRRDTIWLRDCTGACVALSLGPSPAWPVFGLWADDGQEPLVRSPIALSQIPREIRDQLRFDLETEPAPVLTDPHVDPRSPVRRDQPFRVSALWDPLWESTNAGDPPMSRLLWSRNDDWNSIWGSEHSVSTNPLWGLCFRIVDPSGLLTPMRLVVGTLILTVRAVVHVTVVPWPHVALSQRMRADRTSDMFAVRSHTLSVTPEPGHSHVRLKGPDDTYDNNESRYQVRKRNLRQTAVKLREDVVAFHLQSKKDPWSHPLHRTPRLLLTSPQNPHPYWEGHPDQVRHARSRRTLPVSQATRFGYNPKFLAAFEDCSKLTSPESLALLASHKLAVPGYNDKADSERNPPLSGFLPGDAFVSPS